MQAHPTRHLPNTMTPLLRSPEIRVIEKQAIDSGAPLMARAGLAAASCARAMLANAAQAPAQILILAGPGNNGGDAFEVAVHLQRWGYAVTVTSLADPSDLPQDAAAAFAKWRDAGGACTADLPPLQDIDLIVDGLFGIGLARPIDAPYRGWISAINASNKPVLALDVPSGLDADTGAVHGISVRATRTVTFIADKPGLHTLDGPDHAGVIEVAALELRLPADPGTGQLVSPQHFAALLAPRARNTHKGSFGTLGIVGGAPGMVGAALLAGRSAIKLGAGKVFVGILDEHAPVVDVLQPELMLRPAADVDFNHCDALVVGPGLGTSAAARARLVAAISTTLPLLLDADALNLAGGDSTLAIAISRRRAPTVLTPHPQEAARLLGTTTAEVQADRIDAACKLAQRFHACVVLKGAGSVIAAPGDTPRWWINPTGNPGMASAGMGDTLSGLIGALLAQNATPATPETLGASASQADAALQALVGAVFLHGAAADLLVQQGTGPIGLTASDLIDAARRLWNQWVHAASPTTSRP